MADDVTVKSARTLIGKVVSNGMDKSIVVRVVRKIRHPRYGKYINRSSKICVHDEDNRCKVGETVVVRASRPYSKRKAWTLVEVV